MLKHTIYNVVLALVAALIVPLSLLSRGIASLQIEKDALTAQLRDLEESTVGCYGVDNSVYTGNL